MPFKKNLILDLLLVSSIIILFLFTHSSLLIGKRIFTHDTIWFYGIFHYFAGSLREGVFPMWNPYDGSGQPFYTDLAVQYIINPITLCLIMLSSFIKGSILTLFHWNMLVKILIMNLGVYLVFRKLMKNVFSAWFAFAVLLFSSVTITSFRQSGFIYTLGWYPWALYFLIEYLDTHKLRDIMGLALFAGFSLVFYQGLGVILALLVFCITLMINNRHLFIAIIKNHKNILPIVSALFIFIMLMAPLGTLFAEKDRYIPTSRLHTSSEGSASYADDVTGHFSEWGDFLCLFNQEMAARGYFSGKHRLSEGYMYIGIIPVLFGALGIVCGKCKFKVNFLITMIFLFLLMLGKSVYLEQIIKTLFPPFKYFRHMNLFAGFFLFHLVYFTGLGVDYLLKLLQGRKKQLAVGFLALFLTFIDLAGFTKKSYAFVTAPKHPAIDFNEYEIRPVFRDRREDKIVSLGFLRYYRSILYQQPTAFETSSVAPDFLKGSFPMDLYDLYLNIVVYEKYSFCNYINDYNTQEFFDKCFQEYASWRSDEKIAFLLLLKYMTADFLQEMEFYRSFTGFREAIIALQKSILAGYIDILTFSRPWGQVEEAQKSLNTMLALKFSIDPAAFKRAYPLKWGGGPVAFADRKQLHQRLFAGEDVFYYIKYLWGINHSEEFTLLQLRPYFYINNYLRKRTDAPAKGEILMRKWAGVDSPIIDFYTKSKILKKEDILSTALADINGDYLYFDTANQNSDRIQILGGNAASFEYKVIDYGANHVSIDIDVSENGYIYVSQGYDRWWRAFVDGEETDLLRANIAFQAVYVPKGKHSVYLVYQPTHYISALGLFYIAFVLAAGLVLFSFGRRNKY